MNRHNLAMEKFTAARDRWEQQARSRMEKEHYFDSLTKESEIRRSKMDYYVDKYAKEKSLPSRHKFEDFYRAELAKDPLATNYGTLMRSAAFATMGGIPTYVAVKYI